jgi:hypothetical protein
VGDEDEAEEAECSRRASRSRGTSLPTSGEGHRCSRRTFAGRAPAGTGERMRVEADRGSGSAGGGGRGRHSSWSFEEKEEGEGDDEAAAKRASS